MTDYRLRNTDLFDSRKNSPGTGIIVLFASIGFIAMIIAVSCLADRFNPGSAVSQASAQVVSPTALGRPRP